MEFRIHREGMENIAELTGDYLQIRSVEDAVDLLGNASYSGASMVILHAVQLDPAFFALRTGLAGEILQKFSNYHMKLAIVGDYKHSESKSLRDFMYESNRLGHILFVESLAEALERI